jgi:hypothetical protein
MPVLIDEAIAEVEPDAAASAESDAAANPLPLSPPEAELARTFALIRERQERLRVD